jgi:hypothetical protein
MKAHKVEGMSLNFSSYFFTVFSLLTWFSFRSRRVADNDEDEEQRNGGDAIVDEFGNPLRAGDRQFVDRLIAEDGNEPLLNRKNSLLSVFILQRDPENIRRELMQAA